MGITSIVILSCNTYNLTRQCIESIRRYTEIGSYELIVVDNGSTDGSVEYLKQQSDVRGVYNKKNVGFSKGYNQGIMIAQGTEILLLKSDTVATSRWLSQLKYALYSEDKVGVVSCVTNYGSDAQQLKSVPYNIQNLDDLSEFAEHYNHTDAKSWVEKTTLVGGCLCVKKSVIDEIGLLDEMFTLGSYAEEDYSLRIIKAGYRLILCADTFIYYYGNVSFLRIMDAEESGNGNYDELLKRNHCFFYNKWDVPMDVWPVMELNHLLNYQKLKHPTDIWRLDESKICFICSVNDTGKYNESLGYWKKLQVPTGMQVESLVIHGANSMTEAYAAAMSQSDAKYKIYIHQDVWITQLDFLEVMVNSFKSDMSIGIMGVVGSKNIPESAVWWEGELVGAIRDDHTGTMEKYLYERNDRNCQEAIALDGLLLMTQYDILWRTDIFDKWHFYDLSQCMEFYHRGYKVAVMPQSMPSAMHWCGQNPMYGFDEQREKFIREYM